MRKDRVAPLLRFLLLRYKASAQTCRILEQFLALEDGSKRSLEVSSDSTQDPGKEYLRVALFVLKREEIANILLGTKLHNLDANSFLFSNNRDYCFGVGIGDYRSQGRESRLKLYNFYHKSRKTVVARRHIRDICEKGGISFSPVAKDLELLRAIPFSSLDIYDDGAVGLKVYSRYLLTKDILRNYGTLLNGDVFNKYERLLREGCLPKVFSFCVRYNGSLRSVRTDFLCNTGQVLPYLNVFDSDGSAGRLYQELLRHKATIELTYIGMDLHNRPRTQFNFSVD